MSLDERYQRLDDAIVQVKAELADAGNFLSCGGAGCHGCCRGSVQVSTDEIPSVFAAIDAAAWQRVSDAAVALENDPDRAVCPLLDPITGGCSIYAARPAVCRVYAVVTPRDWCWPERVGTHQVAQPMPLIMLLHTAFEMRVENLVVLGGALLRSAESRE